MTRETAEGIAIASDAEPASAKRLCFGPYILDLSRGTLQRNGEEVALRPKTFAVLCHLVENAGRLVPKDELFSAVWRNIAITEDVLVQSIGELRRALGDDGALLIRTVPRRGYRFDGDLRPETIGSRSTMPDRQDAAPETADTGAERASSVPILTSAPVSPPRRAAIAAGGALLLVFAVAGAWFALQRSQPAPVHAPAAAVDVSAKPVIAVLPFRNQSEDASREYFVDGLTQDVISALGRFSALTVMSWNAVLPYKGKTASPGEIARELSVRYQIEGSVRHNGDRVRVSVQLVGTDGRVLWSESLEEALGDLFALQDKMTSLMATALAVRLTQIEQRRVLAKPTESLEAYDLVLRARPALQQPERAANAQARTLLRRAIELDPNYAAAHAGLSETFYNAVSMGWSESPAAFSKRAEELARKAISLDGDNVQARVVLGRILLNYDRHDEALTELDRAIAINPNDAQALAGRGNVLMWLGQTDAAIEGLERAQRIDPEISPFDRFALGVAYYARHRYAAAIEQAELSLRKAEHARYSYAVLAAAYAQQDRPDDAARVMTLMYRSDPTFDPQTFGNKFLNPSDVEHLREGLAKAASYLKRRQAD